MMWARVKAEAEERLAKLNLTRHAPLLRLLPALGISSVDLGRAMLRVGLDKSWHGSRTLENRDLEALLHEANHFGG